MIDERMEEQASLHVLGALSDTEAYEFKKAMKADPELQACVARLSVATGALAGSVPMTEPPPQLRAKILAQVAPAQKTISLPERKSGFSLWLPWSLATCLALLCVLFFAQDNRLRQTIGEQEKQIDNLNSLAASLSAATNHLQQTVLALQETNRLAGLKIAMLNSLLADAPKAIAVSLWDNEKQNGVFVAQNLKSLPVDKDYQLWVLDNGTTPVDAGVFHVDENGGVRVEFTAKLPVKIAGRFAVTEEVKGGVAAPTIKNMVLASN
jgi:anti-sigma-K factor RskA